MRKLTTSTALFVLCTIFCGCATPIQTYLKENPNTSGKVARAMKNGEICSGMSKEELKLVAGEPIDVKQWMPTGRGKFVFIRNNSPENATNQA